MKKIALLADGWKRLITYAWIRGINAFNENHSEPIEICHYNCMGNWSNDPVFNQGEYNIFNLPELDRYDGIIIDINTMKDTAQRRHLIEIVKKSGVPAISLGNFVEDLYYVGIDNRRAIRQMMIHLKNEHNCQSFCFVGGPKNSSENLIRAEAFRECIKEWNLDESINTVSYGTFEMNSGNDYFHKYIDEGRTIPDAFICANDNIAAGLMDEAQKNGYSIPHDFAVTGFDNLDKAICFNPQITTVSHKREILAGHCMELFDKIWKGKPVEQCHYIEPEISYTESCGCPFLTSIDYREGARRNIIENEHRRMFEEKRVGLESRLTSARDFKEIFLDAGEYFDQLECDGITLVVDERLLTLGDEREFPVRGYERGRLRVVYDSDVKQPGEYETFDSYWEKKESGPNNDVWMFTPLHYRDRSIGFSILKNGKFLYDNPYFYDIQSLLNRVIWEMYQRQCYIEANRKLDFLYKRDALTGTYNRMAYFEMAEIISEKCRILNQDCLIAFFDCDNFKIINDEQGHAKGDEILKKIGTILSDACSRKGGAFRFGGDEFVVLYPLENKETANEIINRLNKRFDNEGIQVSIGTCVMDAEKKKSLQEYLDMADQSMYENKKSKRVGRHRDRT